MMAVGERHRPPRRSQPQSVASAQMDGIGFATTGDGGINNDYRVFRQSATFADPSTGYYAAGTDVTAPRTPTILRRVPHHPRRQDRPEVQKGISTAEYGSDAANTQEGSTQPGAFGFAWHKVEISNDGHSSSGRSMTSSSATVRSPARVQRQQPGPWACRM